MKVFRRFVQVLVMLTQAAVPFAAYGSLDWIMAWAYAVVIVGTIIAVVTVLGIALRKNLTIQRNTEDEWNALVSNLLYIIIQMPVLLVAGLSWRFGWLPHVPLWIQEVALFVVILGWSFFFWAMQSNPFFSASLRLTKQPGQVLVEVGPYRYMRHPGNTGLVLQVVGSALALGSFWALIPAAIVSSFYIVLTAREDAFLMQVLDGYRDYSKLVHYRLLPRVW